MELPADAAVTALKDPKYTHTHTHTHTIHAMTAYISEPINRIAKTNKATDTIPIPEMIKRIVKMIPAILNHQKPHACPLLSIASS